MLTEEQVWRIAEAAYEAGWRDACDDHMQQATDARHPLGTRKRAGVLRRLDPLNLLGAWGQE